MSSVGQAVGGIVGGTIGFFLGGPAGALRGAQLGIMAGGLLDPPKQQGPRLQDLSFQASTYGAFIPRDYGTIAHTGNVFWLKGNSLTENSKTSSGGKGGPKVTTYSYSATFAVGLCEGPIDGVRRIWIGAELFYDAGSADIGGIIASNQAAQGFTLYRGTEDQQPDPLMQADRGAANVPAYRGLAYIVFHDLQLEKHGNNLAAAQVKVEVVTQPAYAWVTGDLARAERVVGDPILPTLGNPNAVVFPRMSLDDTVMVVSTGQSGKYFVEVFRVKEGGVKARSLGVFELPGSSTTPSVPVGKSQRGAVPRIGYFTNNTTFAMLTLDGRSLLDDPNGYTTSLPTSMGAGFCVWVEDEDGYVYLIRTDSTASGMVKIAQADFNTGVVAASTGAFAHTSQAVDAYGSHVYVLSRQTGLNTHYVRRYLKSDLSFVDEAVIVSANTKTGGGSPDVRDIHVVGDNHYYLLVESTLAGHAGLVLLEYDNGTLTKHTPDVGVVIPHPSRLQLHAVNGGTFLTGLNRSTIENKLTIAGKYMDSTQGVQLGAVVQTECLGSRLIEAADIDVSSLTDTVRGFSVSNLGPIRAGLDVLRAAWPFDVRQHGYQIEFVRRGGSSVATIPAGDLAAVRADAEPGVHITQAREMDLMLPRALSIKYLDADREYDTNEAEEARINTDAVNRQSVDLAVVMTAEEAKRTAAMLLYLAWMERHDVAFSLPPQYLDLEPGDVITVQAEQATYTLRLIAINATPEGIIECKAKLADAAIYTQVGVADGGESTGQTLSLAGPTLALPLDIPLMRDADDTPGYPVAIDGYLAGWPGGILFRSDDGGQSWVDVVAGYPPGAVVGYATDKLDTHGGTVLDFSGTLTVRLHSGDLASVTDEQMFNGANWFAYGVAGRWEIIATRTATLQGDGSYILRDFLRGQRGTEWATGLHQPNDWLVLLDAAALQFVLAGSANINVPKAMRGITIGKPIDSDSDTSFTYTGVNLECLSPVHLTGHRHPSNNDWTLTWTRRSRFAEWRDYVDAALGEASEAYEVEICNSAYTSVLRTLSVSAATASYTSAQQVADFGSNQATLYLRVYQLSATVGRGYPLTISITR